MSIMPFIEFKKQTAHIFSERHMWDPMDHIKKDFQATFFERPGWKGLCTGTAKQSCASEVEGYMLSHDCESRGPFLWVWCVLAVALHSRRLLRPTIGPWSFTKWIFIVCLQMEKLGKVNNNNYFENREREGEMIVHGGQGLLKNNRTWQEKKKLQILL